MLKFTGEATFVYWTKNMMLTVLLLLAPLLIAKPEVSQEVKVRDLRTETSDFPRDTSVVISPTGPVSVGSMVNLTWSCSRNRPVHFVWFMVSDGRLELIRADTQVYSFSVTSSD